MTMTNLATFIFIIKIIFLFPLFTSPGTGFATETKKKKSFDYHCLNQRSKLLRFTDGFHISHMVFISLMRNTTPTPV